MLAPRKTLWSTPDAVIERVIERTNPDNASDRGDVVWFALDADDIVCDVGCGDGRVLLRWAARVSEAGLGEPMTSKEDASQDFPPQPSSSHEALHTRQATTTTEPSFPSFVGIDVDPVRIRCAQDELDRLRKQGRIHPDVSVEFWCQNALDCAPRLQKVTVYFLYLIPRGLRIVKPLLFGTQRGEEPARSSSPPLVRVITYMSPLEGEVPVQVDRVSVPHQPGASWPLYYYELKREPTGNGNDVH